MSLETTMNTAIVVAMKAKDKVALDSLRAVKAQVLLLKTESKGAEITEEQEIAILQRMVKQRKDSFEQFAAQGRTDLAEIETAQIKVIEEYLPKQLTDEELEADIKKIIEQTNASSIKEMGKVIGMASKQMAGKAEGKRISEMVKKLLA